MEDEFGGKKGVHSMPLTLGRVARTLCPHRMKRQSLYIASWEEFRSWVAVRCGEDRRRPRSERRIPLHHSHCESARQSRQHKLKWFEDRRERGLRSQARRRDFMLLRILAAISLSPRSGEGVSLAYGLGLSTCAWDDLTGGYVPVFDVIGAYLRRLE
ncbi:uncharacterized protein ARMOST_11428 [Armillaria ostoyae]|uniref:Uncharacterized protein n=1 Tax=Armillaria ostoyae TaxID=47428 RepID=A0A284RH44_ARMOS|nr:uncharacterized protein ARMOST_11428 [Armillaria ostoyae]